MGFTLSLLVSGAAIPIGGYQLSFLLTCGGPTIAAILAWATLAKTTATLQLRRREQRFVKEVLRNRPAMLLIGAYTFHCWELLGNWAWTPAFLSACLAITGTETTRAAGFGASISGAFHLAGLLASFSMGALSDRYDRSYVIIALAGMSAMCSFVFGWTIGWPIAAVVTLALVYGFLSLGDSPVLSTAITEVVEPAYLGATYGFRSLLGFGAGAVSPMLFGAVLDRTNPLASSPLRYTTWGWAYISLGVGGAAAVLCTYALSRVHQFRKDR
jgi:sugar phosphate permease